MQNSGIFPGLSDNVAKVIIDFGKQGLKRDPPDPRKAVQHPVHDQASSSA
jgi:hypothetical protein